jgi:zinc protease
MTLIRRCFLALLLLLTPLQPIAAAPPAWLYEHSDIPPDPAWQFGTLRNGLRYAVRRNSLPAGQISIRIRIDAGSLHEGPAERGWAHFVEHLAFRGTRSFADREARHLWQQLGASFGSDTNASTSHKQTVYQLDLPRFDDKALEQSFSILAEMVDDALFEPAAVEAERRIVLAEKRRRSELANRIVEISRPLFYAGLTFAERDPIGTEATLQAANPAGLRAFYERWYRPERTTLVVVGDTDPPKIERLIARHFAGWKGTGPAPATPDFGEIAPVDPPVAALTYPGAPASASVQWLRPHVETPDTVARTRDEIAERLAGQIINRRFEAKARGEASFISATVNVARERSVADTTLLSLTAREDKWREALTESFAIVADALRSPPSAAEIARELSNLRTVLAAAVESEPSQRSPQWANHLVGAIDRGDVVTSAAHLLALFDRLAPDMTPARVETAMKAIFSGTPPRLLLLTPEPVAGGLATVSAALDDAEGAAPAERQADRTVNFDVLPTLGSPGREVSRQHIADMDVTIVRFANGSSLTFKRTDFTRGSVSVKLRFGNGIAGLSPQQPSLTWMSAVVAPSGLADLDLDSMERLLTGRRISLNFGVEENAVSLAGATSAEDLADQLRLLAAKLAFPRWDSSLYNRFKAGWIANYEMSFASATARAMREMNAVTRPADQRWVPVTKEEIADAGPEEFRAYFTRMMAAGPIEAIIVGDTTLDAAISAMARTVAALPPRPRVDPTVHQVRPPASDPKPRVFTHTGDASQAYALIGWTTFGGLERIRERRALTIASNILQQRLFDRLREEEGATYSPAANASSSETFPQWGIFYAAAEIKPESVDTFFRIAREEVARLARAPVPADEFLRITNPIVSSIERRLKTNSYWMETVEDWPENPILIEQTRNHVSDYRSLTAEEVRAAVAAYVADAGDWSMLVLPEKG